MLTSSPPCILVEDEFRSWNYRIVWEKILQGWTDGRRKKKSVKLEKSERESEDDEEKNTHNATFPAIKNAALMRPSIRAMKSGSAQSRDLGGG